MKTRYILILVVFVMVFAGCNGGHCIKVGGTYQGVSGDVEYCFDTGKSEGLGVPVFDELMDTGETTELFSFTEDQINEILEKVKEKAGFSALNVPEQGQEQEHPVTQLLRIIEPEEDKENAE